MIRETRGLLAALNKLNRALPNVMVGIWDESLPPDRQVEFGDLLIAAGELLQQHARSERPTIIGGDAHHVTARHGGTGRPEWKGQG